MAEDDKECVDVHSVEERTKSVSDSEIECEEPGFQNEEENTSRSEIVGKCVREDEASLGGPRFSPPLYRQRYSLCADILKSHGVKSVVDFGCAECQIMMYFKHVTCLEHVALVDVDSVCLQMNKHKIRPLITDHLSPRDNPLTVTMFQGSLTDFDSRLLDYEAITMVEVIEHLPDKALREFPLVLFGKLHPRIVIVTTPNSDFNQLFPDLNGFRHWDHKFEWSREEFSSWCNEQAELYGYDVKYTGVGLGPSGSEHLGFCSQAAIFISKKPRQIEITDEQHFTVISSAVHPHKVERYTQEEVVQMDVDYYIRYLSHDADGENEHENIEDEEDTIFIALKKLLDFKKVKTHFTSFDDLRTFLINHDYRFSDDQTCVIFTRERDSSCEEAEEGFDQLAANFETSGQFSDAENDTTVYNSP